MERIVTNMHGLTLKVRGWKIYTTFPHLEDCTKMIMDKDSRTGQSIISIYTHKKYYMAVQARHYRVWILYRLKYLNYNELKDIRKSHLHGNKYHS